MTTSLKKPKVVSVTDTTTDTTFSLLIFHYVFAIVKSMNKLILILGSVLIISGCGPSQEERNEESSKTTQKIEKTYLLCSATGKTFNAKFYIELDTPTEGNKFCLGDIRCKATKFFDNDAIFNSSNYKAQPIVGAEEILHNNRMVSIRFREATINIQLIAWIRGHLNPILKDDGYLDISRTSLQFTYTDQYAGGETEYPGQCEVISQEALISTYDQIVADKEITLNKKKMKVMQNKQKLIDDRVL